MKIRLTTEREMPVDQFETWVSALNKVGIPVDARMLLKTGRWGFQSHQGAQTVRTVYEIIEEGDKP